MDRASSSPAQSSPSSSSSHTNQPSPLALARAKILAADQGRLHKARASVVDLNEIISGPGSAGAAAHQLTVRGDGSGDSARVDEEKGDRGAGRRGRNVTEAPSSFQIYEAYVVDHGPSDSASTQTLADMTPFAPLPPVISPSAPFSAYNLPSPESSTVPLNDMEAPSHGRHSSSHDFRPGRSSYEPLIPLRTTSHPVLYEGSSPPDEVSARSKAKGKFTRPRVKPAGSGTGSGHSASLSFQSLLSRSRSDSTPNEDEQITSLATTLGLTGRSLPSFRRPLAETADPPSSSDGEEQVTSLPPVPATLTDPDPEKKMVLIRRARKLEKVLGEALSESEMGELVVDPARGKGRAGVGRKRAREGDRMLEGLVFPPARGIEEVDHAASGRQERSLITFADVGPDDIPITRHRVSSEPELFSPVVGSFDHGDDLIPRPKSSLDYTDAGSEIALTARQRYIDHDSDDISVCVDDSSAGGGSWLKRVGSKLSGHVRSHPSSPGVPTLNTQRLGRIARGGSAATQKAIDKDLRDNGVRVLVKQEKFTVRTSYLDPSWLPSRPTQNRRVSGMSAVARMAELKAMRRHSSPVSPTFGVGFLEQGQKLDGLGMEIRGEEARSPGGWLTEDARRVKRAQLAKLHRLLGTRVPIELLLNKGDSPATTPDETYRSSPLQPLPVAQSTLDAIPGLYEDMPMTPEEKARAVKRASKMISKFGSAPPVTLYLPESNVRAAGKGPERATDSGRANTYRQSLISLKYLIDNDQNSLNDVLSDLMEESENDDADTTASPRMASPANPKLVRRVSSPPSIRRSLDAYSHREATPPSPRSPDAFSPDGFGLRRKRAGKISKFFGEDNLGSRHLQDFSVGGEASRNSFSSRRSVLLDRVLEEIQQGAEADKAQGLLEDEELNDVRDHIIALRERVCLKRLDETSA